MSVVVKSKDKIIMQLVHYFVTEENYQPMVVNGVKNEIWLENLEAPYRIIRINSNYIHNEEQLQYDHFKIKNVMRQIKRKTFSLKMNTLNILLDLNEGVNIKDNKHIETLKVDSIVELKTKKSLVEVFPKLKSINFSVKNDIMNLINITNDINSKTEAENQDYENIFKKKKLYITNILIGINILMFILTMLNPNLLNNLILNPLLVKSGEYYRLITAMFLHGSVLHLFVNMYSLWIIGNQLENFLGKNKYLVIYLISGLSGSLMSVSLTGSLSLGASGAIFGLLGSLLYFGYNYRLYLGSVLVRQLIPIIILNLSIGFLIPGIDNAAHVGGLVGGLFITMALGIGKKTEKVTHINGIITLSIYLGFLIYLLFK